MADVQKTVFISYRRSISSFTARAIFQDLLLNKYDVFMDVESIGSGRFETIILNQIAARAHFLVILEPGVVERCESPDDWLRREIEHAMDLKRNIVPVWVNRFSVRGVEQYLSGKLSTLANYNPLRIPQEQEYFDAAMERLRNQFLKQPVYGAVIAPPLDEQQVVAHELADLVRSEIDPPVAIDIDTVVVPALDDSFQNMFIAQNRWYAIRMQEHMRRKVKYIAVYQVAPISAITHFAPIANIKPWEDTQKVVVNFSEPARPLNTPVRLISSGKVKPVYNLRYTTLARLQSAKTLDDVWG